MSLTHCAQLADLLIRIQMQRWFFFWYSSTLIKINYNWYSIINMTGQEALVWFHQPQKLYQKLQGSSAWILVHSSLTYLCIFLYSGTYYNSKCDRIRKWLIITLKISLNGFNWFLASFSTIHTIYLINLGLHFLLRPHPGGLDPTNFILFNKIGFPLKPLPLMWKSTMFLSSSDISHLFFFCSMFGVVRTTVPKSTGIGCMADERLEGTCDANSGQTLSLKHNFNYLTIMYVITWSLTFYENGR